MKTTLAALFILLGFTAIAAEPDIAALQASAEKGDAKAQYQLGFDYHYGLGTKKDSAKALAWWQKAAKQNDAKALIMVGAATAEGWGTKPDAKDAMLWYQKASDLGSGDAKHLLATIYEFGFEGMPKDHPKAEALWHEALEPLHVAAEAGDADAQCDLGTIYMKGWGVPADSSESMKWRRLAAEQGNPEGEMALAVNYRAGIGTPKDDIVATEWYAKAAAHGEVYAQSELGRAYRDGRGVAKDAALAYMWLDIAMAQGDENAAHEMVEVARSMTFTQYQEASKKAHDWQAEHIAVP